MTELSTVR